MREMRLRKPPFVVLLALELAVVAGLGYVAVHVWQQRGPSSAPKLSQPLGPPAGPEAERPPAAAPNPVASARPPAPPTGKPRQPRSGQPPAPDLAIGKQQAARLNQAEARWEASEWTILSQLTRAAEEYLRKVVLPIVIAAERR